MTHKLPSLHELPHDDVLSHEDLLIALDQLDQTVEVMTTLIKRIKRQLAHPNTSPSEQESSSLPDYDANGGLH